ncbi:MAG: aminotransferase class V-fold PLP-dependent enzyme [Phycisphaerales bacterium]|nr:aminotransferase class V-fold PLP-dependent enzyme [Phycisphaerales bacterium]
MMNIDSNWHDEFPILDRLDFFNHAGVAPLSGAAGRALIRYTQQAQQQAYHKSDWYKQALNVKKLAARFIGATDENEIAFVPNTSTGLSLVAKGLAWRQGDQVVISKVEYPANRYPLAGPGPFWRGTGGS